MSFKNDTRLTPRQRLGRGLARTAAGPVDVARGTVGLSAQAVAATISGVRQRYQDGRLRQELAAAQELLGRELAAAQEVVTGLPAVIAEARTPRRRLRPWLLAGAGVAVVAGGALAFSMIRRSRRPEPSTLPPSVQVEPRP
jgi:Cell wall synthesis protein CwsA